MSTIISPLTSPIPNQYFKQLPPPQQRKQLLSNRKPQNTTTTTTREVHYYDNPSFFEDDDDDKSSNCKEAYHKKSNSDLTLPQFSPISFQSTNTSIHSNNSSIKSPTIHTTTSSAHSSYYSAKSTTNTYHTLNNNSQPHRKDNTNHTKIMEMDHLNNRMNQHEQYIHKSSSSISKLSGAPPPKCPSNQPQKSKKKDGSIVYNVYSHHGKRVMVLEIVNGKSQVVAATKEQLFLKLADESPQDFDYVDTFLSNHTSFTTSQELLYSLIDRFHIEPVPGHECYFQQWQKRIQVKVLNVLTRWIKLQFRDFLRDISLHERLEQFCDLDMIKAGFATESTMIKEAMYNQKYRYYQSIYNLQSTTHVNNHHPPSTPPPSSLRRPSGSGSLFSMNHISPPESPIYPTYHHHHSAIGILANNNNNNSNNNNNNNSPLLTLETKDIAKYLTLADYYLFQQIKSYDYLDGHWRHCQYNDFSLDELETKEDYIGILTKRANMMNHWVIHELATAKSTKHKRSLLRKFIDIAKICLEWNNFHTCMILTMGLLSYPVQKIEEVWQSLPNRDQLTFETLKKLVDVSHNMSFYRQALQEGGLHPGLFGHHKKRSTSFSSSSSNPNFSLSFTSHHHHNDSNMTSTSSLPTLPFFPMVLKDITFLMESDTIYNSDLDNDDNNNNSNKNNKNSTNDDDDGDDQKSKSNELIHFSKFYGLSRYLTKIMHYTAGHYWFSVELESKPFLSRHYNKLTDIPDSTRTSFSSNSATLYQDQSYTTSSSTTALSSSQSPPLPSHQHPHHNSSPLSPPPPPHSSSHNLWSLSTSSSISSTLNTTFFSSPFPTSFLSNNNNTIITLDQVADIIEKRVSNVVSCYTDPQCESYLLSLLKPL
ncbi:unnamed protein product [Cunninghamella blakesleeana]